MNSELAVRRDAGWTGRRGDLNAADRIFETMHLTKHGIRRRGFERADVATRSEWARFAALIGRRTEGLVGGFQRRTAGQQRHRWRGAAVVGQRAESWVCVDQAARGGEETTGVGGK